MDIDEARKIILEAVAATTNTSDQSISLSSVIQVLQQRQRYYGTEQEQLFLTCWYDLFRTGVLSWGYNFANSGMGQVHVTEHGKKTLTQHSRDPANPKGYIAVLDPVLPKGTVARSYIEEAVQTYNFGCDRATAVLVGGASEAMALDFRDALVDKMTPLGKVVSKDFQSRNIKSVLDAIESELKPYTKKGAAAQMPNELAERFSSNWSSFTGQIRMVRNEVGHPKSVEPVTRDRVHGCLLIFPEVAKLVADLQAWVQSSYA